MEYSKEERTTFIVITFEDSNEANLSVCLDKQVLPDSWIYLSSHIPSIPDSHEELKLELMPLFHGRHLSRIVEVLLRRVAYRTSETTSLIVDRDATGTTRALMFL